MRKILAAVAMLVTGGLAPETGVAAGPAYCLFYAREYVRIDAMTTTDVDLMTATPEMLLGMVERRYRWCLTARDFVPLPGTPLERSSTLWAHHLSTMVKGRWERHLDTIGNTPAGPATPARPGWIAACERDYRSWDAETQTVVRRRSRGRVKCPYETGERSWD